MNALTCAASKIFERIVRNDIMTFLVENNLISKTQHGFLPKHSTITNLLCTTTAWFNARHNKESVHICYIDFAKAFDTVSHEKLIFKLSRYGLCDKVLLWIKQFLSNRCQSVHVDGYDSDSHSVLSGVPQGTVLGPLLFLLYVNDLPDVVKSSEIALFADDAKLFINTSDVITSQLLQTDLHNICRWADQWQLKIAVEKCSVLIFGPSTADVLYYLDDPDSPLQIVPDAVDLGITISSEQKFSSHCFKIAKKARMVSSHIFRAFKTRDEFFLLKMYKTYVRPILENGTQLWSPHQLKDIDVIEKVQRSYTKRFTRISHLSYNERLNALKLDSLERRRITSDLVLAFKIVHGYDSLPFDKFFTYDTYIGPRSHSKKLLLPFARTDTVKNSFAFRLPAIWNSLTEDVVSSRTLQKFENSIKMLNFDIFLRGRSIR